MGQCLPASGSEIRLAFKRFRQRLYTRRMVSGFEAVLLRMLTGDLGHREGRLWQSLWQTNAFNFAYQRADERQP
jgi:hypothetical protein